MNKKTILSLLLVVIVVGAGFFLLQSNSKNSTAKNTDSKHQLIVSVLPQKQILEKIAGDAFAVNELIPPGFSPATYDPTAEEMKLVADADIYFRIGHIPFERTNLEKLEEINPSMIVIDTSVNNTLREIEAHSHEDEEEHHDDDHDEEHDGEDNHETEDMNSIDPHVWLSPAMVQEQSEVIYDTLVQNYPEYSDEFTTNFEQLSTDLENLDQELAKDLTPIQGKTMFVYHPAFGYLADAYGFTQEHIEIEGKEPSIDDIQDIIDQAKQENVTVIFVQKQFNKDSAISIADNIDGVVVEIDPLDPDYFTNMRTMGQVISESLL